MAHPLCSARLLVRTLLRRRFSSSSSSSSSPSPSSSSSSPPPPLPPQQQQQQQQQPLPLRVRLIHGVWSFGLAWGALTFLDGPSAHRYVFDRVGRDLSREVESVGRPKNLSLIGLWPLAVANLGGGMLDHPEVLAALRTVPEHPSSTDAEVRLVARIYAGLASRCDGPAARMLAETDLPALLREAAKREARDPEMTNLVGSVVASLVRNGATAEQVGGAATADWIRRVLAARDAGDDVRGPAAAARELGLSDVPVVGRSGPLGVEANYLLSAASPSPVRQQWSSVPAPLARTLLWAPSLVPWAALYGSVRAVTRVYPRTRRWPSVNAISAGALTMTAASVAALAAWQSLRDVYARNNRSAEDSSLLRARVAATVALVQSFATSPATRGAVLPVAIALNSPKLGTYFREVWPN